MLVYVRLKEMKHLLLTGQKTLLYQLTPKSRSRTLPLNADSVISM